MSIIIFETDYTKKLLSKDKINIMIEDGRVPFLIYDESKYYEVYDDGRYSEINDPENFKNPINKILYENVINKYGFGDIVCFNYMGMYASYEWEFYIARTLKYCNYFGLIELNALKLTKKEYMHSGYKGDEDELLYNEERDIDYRLYTPKMYKKGEYEYGPILISHFIIETESG